MPVPKRWTEVLNGPAFVINMNSRPERLAASTQALLGAGFTQVHRFSAIDASDAGELKAAWEACGSPPFAMWDRKFQTLIGKQGCFLSHIGVWKEIVDQNLPFACVFEDDVFFHRHWTQLASTCFDLTPQDYDILFMGNQIEEPGHGLVRRTPVYCLHGYLITHEGAGKLRPLLLQDPNGVATIDWMVFNHQRAEMHRTRACPFSWYVWSGMGFPDPGGMKYPKWQRRNTGLIFQNYELGTDVDHTHL